MLLDSIPGIRNHGVILVGGNRHDHFLVHSFIHLVPEDISQDASYKHGYEYHEEYYEVRQQHALDLLEGAEASEEGDYRDHDTGGDEYGRRADVQVRAQETLHEGPVGQGPDAHREHHHAANHDDEVGHEEGILDYFPAPLQHPGILAALVVVHRRVPNSGARRLLATIRRWGPDVARGQGRRASDAALVVGRETETRRQRRRFTVQVEAASVLSSASVGLCGALVVSQRSSPSALVAIARIE